MKLAPHDALAEPYSQAIVLTMSTPVRDGSVSGEVRISARRKSAEDFEK
jgi:hypothetical protein